MEVLPEVWSFVRLRRGFCHLTKGKVYEVIALRKGSTIGAMFADEKLFPIVVDDSGEEQGIHEDHLEAIESSVVSATDYGVLEYEDVIAAQEAMDV